MSALKIQNTISDENIIKFDSYHSFHQYTYTCSFLFHFRRFSIILSPQVHSTQIHVRIYWPLTTST